MRRILLWAALLAAAAVGGVLVWMAAGGDTRRPAALGGAAQEYSAGKWGLTVDGVKLGYLQSVDCGAHSAELIADPVAKTPDPKHAGPFVPAACVVGAGLGLAPGFYEWLGAAIGGSTTRKESVSLSALDFDLKEQSRLDLFGAMITEVTVPKMDAYSKAAVSFTIKLDANGINQKPGTGETFPAGTQQKTWLPANFKFALDGVEVPQVHTVSAWTVKVGEGRPQLGSVVLEVSSAQAGGLDKRLKNAIGGQNPEGSARLTSLTADLQTVVAEIDFEGVGMFAGDLMSYPVVVSTAAGPQTVLRRSFSFYVERAKLGLPQTAP